MRTIWLYFLILVIILGCVPGRKPSDKIRFQHACAFLWEQQAADGGWHSETHGLLRGGESYTAYLLHTLLQVPDSVYPIPHQKRQKALGFIHKHLVDPGVLGLSDPDIIDYPNYATSYAVRLALAYPADSLNQWTGKMLAYLLAQQFGRERGILPEHPAFGSWGFGETRLGPGETGHLDLSHTRRVLQALRESDLESDSMFSRALVFLGRLQKLPAVSCDALGNVPVYDGGFYFSTLIDDANKAKQIPVTDTTASTYRSYATATCDGILALLACGLDTSDPRIKSASKWLESHPGLEFAGGIPLEDPDEWHKVLIFYHLAVRAQAYSAIGRKGAWEHDFLERLAALQQKDGSFRNPDGGRNKEDDPLLATALAIRAYTACLNPRN